MKPMVLETECSLHPSHRRGETQKQGAVIGAEPRKVIHGSVGKRIRPIGVGKEPIESLGDSPRSGCAVAPSGGEPEEADVDEAASVDEIDEVISPPIEAEGGAAPLLRRAGDHVEISANADREAKVGGPAELGPELLPCRPTSACVDDGKNPPDIPRSDNAIESLSRPPKGVHVQSLMSPSQGDATSESDGGNRSDAPLPPKEALELPNSCLVQLCQKISRSCS